MAALAAENASPGDFLYPFKRIVEPVVGIFDSDFAAKHRIEELERLIADEAPADQIQDSYEEAEDAIAGVPGLSDRLEDLRAEIDSDLVDGQSSGDLPSDGSGISPSRGSDTSTTTSTTPSDRGADGETTGGSDRG